MKVPRQNCPGCNSMQTFKPQWRRMGSDVIEVYISCTKCPYSSVLRASTPEIERMHKNEAKLLHRQREEEARHGTASQATLRLLRIVRQEIATAQGELPRC